MTLESVTDSLNKLKGSYGGSKKSSGSFMRPEHVQFNSLSKAKDFGKVVNLSTSITGTVGTQVGANTLFFKVTTIGESDLVITKRSVGNKYKDQYISVGLLNANADQIPLSPRGFGYTNEIINTIPQESGFQLPKGTYYFTVTNSEWVEMPFEIGVQVIRYITIEGKAEGSLFMTGRIGLVKLFGSTSGTIEGSATVTPKAQLKTLGGMADGQALPTLELAILRGTATLRNVNYGRLKATWRISGLASGENQNTATLNVTTPGGGYGP
jgi:hypothetical protein